MFDFGVDCDFGTQDPVEAIPVFVPVEDQFGSKYDSPREAARVLGLRGIDVERQLAGKLDNVKGYRFAFADVAAEWRDVRMAELSAQAAMERGIPLW